jgi:Homeodomain-like domain
MGSMISYTTAAMERAMKVQEVILRALAKRITWWQAAEIIGISDRQMRRWRERYEEFGFQEARGPTNPLFHSAAGFLGTGDAFGVDLRLGSGSQDFG